MEILPDWIRRVPGPANKQQSRKVHLPDRVTALTEDAVGAPDEVGPPLLLESGGVTSKCFPCSSGGAEDALDLPGLIFEVGDIARVLPVSLVGFSGNVFV
jgi:hypothetical protein